ncbi:hypothetical protein HJA87_16050 [Rhizobium bangladeshense]|uniref:Uncharacterized protein n=1 Tax=Rhizobium bangladeshense TaxID=1138189 RepID=A0ABS7LJM8_9HYPH|nr:hypothetical protein [Rhizobium bangladeshense]MBY3591369.1 hypothetical protein [Rhizobium bangladeshense]
MNEASNFRLTKRSASHLPQGPVPIRRTAIIALCSVGTASLLRYLMGARLYRSTIHHNVSGSDGRQHFRGFYCGLLTTILAAIVSAYAWLPALDLFELTQQSWIGLAVFLLASTLIVVVAHLMHLLVRALRQSEEQADLIAKEMKHRMSNLLQMTGRIGEADVQGRRPGTVPGVQ